MNDLTVRDIMSHDFAKVTETMPVVEASNELVKQEALGGPVINAEKQLVGWISEQECLQVTTQFAYHNQRIATVKDIMREEVLTVSESQSVISLAEKMSPKMPKDYPVVNEQNAVVGIITRRRVLKALLKEIS